MPRVTMVQTVRPGGSKGKGSPPVLKLRNGVQVPEASSSLSRSRPARALGGAGGRRGQANGLGVLEVRLDRRDHDASFDGKQLDADQGDLGPSVDDDTLVQDPVDHFRETRAVGRLHHFCHCTPLYAVGSNSDHLSTEVTKQSLLASL